MDKPSKPVVMIVDDSDAILMLMRTILGEANYEIITAISGEEAVEKSLKYSPDVILLDVMMPGIDGFETCSRIKSDARTVDIPILIITIVDDTQNKIKDFEAGASDYLTKPFNPPELVARVKSQVRIKLLHDELKASNEELKNAYTELRNAQLQIIQMAKLSALGEMITNISHELNNPLTDIIDFTKLLLSINDISPYYQYLNKIHDQAERCKKIIKNLLSFSKETSQEKTFYSINYIIKQILKLIKYQLYSDDIKLTTSLNNNLPNIYIDRDQLRQLFLNIINNSYQAMKDIKREKTLTIKSFMENSSIKIEIADNGIGIASENLSKIFDPFFTTFNYG